MCAELTHATPHTSTKGFGQLAIVVPQLRLNLVKRDAANTLVVEGRVPVGVVLLEEGRGEDGIRHVHGLEDVIARGTPEDTDGGDGAGGRDLEEAADQTHCGCFRG